jgi:hypothetical protein
LAAHGIAAFLQWFARVIGFLRIAGVRTRTYGFNRRIRCRIHDRIGEIADRTECPAARRQHSNRGTPRNRENAFAKFHTLHPTRHAYTIEYSFVWVNSFLGSGGAVKSPS